MATLSDLCDRRELEPVDCGLEADEQPIRLLYALPHVVVWLEKELQNVPAELGDEKDDHGTQSPIEQLDELLHDFGAGEDLAYWERSHSMFPDSAGIWELKTTDIRLFGWFVSRGVFIIANIDSGFRCKQHNLYPGYRGDCVRRRDALDLNPPKHIQGSYDDVL